MIIMFGTAPMHGLVNFFAAIKILHIILCILFRHKIQSDDACKPIQWYNAFVGTLCCNNYSDTGISHAAKSSSVRRTVINKRHFRSLPLLALARSHTRRASSQSGFLFCVFVVVCSRRSSSSSSPQLSSFLSQ